MSCPVNRYKHGSGYVKPDVGCNKDLETKMKDMMAVRTAQDNGVFIPVVASKSTVVKSVGVTSATRVAAGNILIS